MSGGSTQTASTSGTQGPWQPTQSYLKNNLKTASTLAQGDNAWMPYGSSTVAPLSDQTQSALTATENLANAGNPLAGQSQGALSSILNGGTAAQYQSLLDNSSNQAFQTALNQQAGTLADNIARQYSVNGRYGSDAMVNDLGTQVGNFINTGLANQWNQNIANQRGILGDMTNSQLNAVQAAPGAYSQSYLPSEYLAQAGSTLDAQNQAQLTDKVNQAQQAAMAPWQQLEETNALYSGTGRLGSNSTAASYSPTNYLAPLGGALSGYQAGVNSGGSGILGALLGGGLGLLGL